MSSPEDRSPISRSNVSRSSSIVGEKSRSRSNLKKDISIDEGDALKKISEEVLQSYILLKNGRCFFFTCLCVCVCVCVVFVIKADEKLKKEKRKTDEARRYLHLKRHQEQAEFSDEETESTVHSKPEATSTPVSHRPAVVGVKGDVLINVSINLFYCLDKY